MERIRTSSMEGTRNDQTFHSGLTCGQYRRICATPRSLDLVLLSESVLDGGGCGGFPPLRAARSGSGGVVSLIPSISKHVCNAVWNSSRRSRSIQIRYVPSVPRISSASSAVRPKWYRLFSLTGMLKISYDEAINCDWRWLEGGLSTCLPASTSIARMAWSGNSCCRNSIKVRSE